MEDTIEKRVTDMEYVLAHLPPDLDVRFAGADARAGARFDQLTIRTQTLELRIRQVEQAVANVGAKLDAIEKATTAKLDEILARLPKA